MIGKRYFTAILLAGFSMTGLSGGAISGYAHWSDETRPSLEDTNSREKVQRVRAKMQPIRARAMERRRAPTRSARELNADGYRQKSLQSCTYRGGPKTGIWTCL